MPKKKKPIRKTALSEIRTAHQRLERTLILDVVEEARSAKSGSHSYGFENIRGVGVSEKLVNGWLTSDPCITVYVAAKAPLDEVQEEARVPEKISGIPTDVVEIGEIRAFPFKGIYRPAPGGVSISHLQVGAGTIACLVRKGGTTCILSNNHILANVNQGRAGDPIVQPGVLDGGQSPTNQIATLTNFVTIDFLGTNVVDCAIAEVQPPLVTSLIQGLGKLSLPPVAAQQNALVSKVGRTTQLTRGRISDTNATVRLDYEVAGPAIFQKQIIVVSLDGNPFSQDGDSGSLIVDKANHPVALVAGGSNGFTIANPIQAVLAALGVAIIA